MGIFIIDAIVILSFVTISHEKFFFSKLGMKISHVWKFTMKIRIFGKVAIKLWKVFH
jgi:hypothetical protein